MSKVTLPGSGAASTDLAQRRSRLSAVQRELLEKRLARGAAAPAAGAAVRPRPVELAGLGEALSFAQQRLWRLARRAPNSTAYNVFHGVRFAGSLDRRALAAALGRLGPASRRPTRARSRWSARCPTPWSARRRPLYR